MRWFRMAAGLMTGIAAAGVLAFASAAAQRFDPGALKGEAAGEVLVLGTAHLSGLPASFRPVDLAPLLDRLAAWKPQFITTESLSGAECEYLRRYAPLHPDAAKTYCWDETPARLATGLDMPAATIEMERLLAALPPRATPAQRRRLAAVMLAAGDGTSALVQWLRLPPAERRTGDGLTQPLADRLARVEVRNNEDYLIAAPLAARLGLDRVWPADDHTADDEVGDDPKFGEALNRIWQNPALTARRQADEALSAKLGTPAGTMALYRSYNAPTAGRIVFDSDFGAALKDRGAGEYGRRYVGWWETRNLRMVANIRSVMARRPGARTLAIVGASHKPYFEAYLGMMHDVRVADTMAVLR
ncbi:DUF5694 domain-containing protein [Sphingomonas sp. 1P08PE]|uniref:DUF5694 domain-containing protein n=1 Tax=Sphingomonas sp. 1P08PE TaxID=554122 RepID=UPI0039A173D4